MTEGDTHPLRRSLPPEVIVRGFDAERGDLEAWTKIHNQRPIALGTLRIPFTPRERWARLFGTGENGRILVAETDGKVIGCIGFHLGQGRRRHTGSLGMAVDVAHHGRGVGGALLAAVIDLADNWYNLRRLELEVYVDNEPAIRLYCGFGFEEEGIYKKFALRNGEYVDALAMARIHEDPWKR